MSSEKTLDRLLSLISTGSSQKALMSLSIFSEFCAHAKTEDDVQETPVRRQEQPEIKPPVVLEERVSRQLDDPEFNFSMCSIEEKKDAWTQCDQESVIPQKDKLLLELQLLEVERKKLEVENLLEENKRTERQQQATLKNIHKVQIQVEESINELAQRHKSAEEVNQRMAKFLEEKGQFQLVREQAEYDRQCLNRERQQFEAEKHEWQLKIEQFAQETQKDSESVREIRSEIERYHRDQRVLVEREVLLEQQLEQLKLQQVELATAREAFRSERQCFLQEKSQLAQQRQQLLLERQDLELSRLELKAETENIKQLIKNHEVQLRQSKENRRSLSDYGGNAQLELNRRKSDFLQSVVTGTTKFGKFQQRWQLSCKKHFMSSLKKKNIADRILDRLAMLFWGRMWAAVDAIKSEAISASKQNLHRNRSPAVKKSLVLRRTRIDSKTQQSEALKSQNFATEVECQSHRELLLSPKPVIQLHRKKNPFQERNEYYNEAQPKQLMTLRSYRVSSSNLATDRSQHEKDKGFRQTNLLEPVNEVPWATSRENSENKPLNKPVRNIRSQTYGAMPTTRERSITATTQKRLKISRNPIV